MPLDQLGTVHIPAAATQPHHSSTAQYQTLFWRNQHKMERSSGSKHQVVLKLTSTTDHLEATGNPTRSWLLSTQQHSCPSHLHKAPPKLQCQLKK
jgi:hypothetical protein